MSRTLPFVAALLLLPALLSGQSSDAPKRKTGAIYKNEVDGLIQALRDTARDGVAAPANAGVLGGDVLSTAKVLVAMGHCHRFYHVSDGPVVRPSLAYLLQSRRADGSFGDVAATAWTVEAFELMDEDRYREEVAVARAWLQRQGGEAPSFARLTQRVLEGVRADRFPQDMAAEAKQQADAWFADPAAIDRSAAADALLQLVACQAANRELDRTQSGDAGATTWSDSQARAFAFLMQQQQDGVFAGDPAMTGFGLMALQSKPRSLRTTEEQAVIEAGLRWLLTKQNEDGTFGERVANYTTCVVVGALDRWQDAAAAPALKRAQKAILMFQNSERGGYERSDRDYGSIGYGSSQRGDLSNLHFSMEALRQTGLPEDHEALQKALVFLQRTQNLKSVNDFSGKVPNPDKEGETMDVTSGDDGGATYYPGNSAAGYIVQPDGKAIPRSYGSMTYALLKAYSLAGVKGDDPRVQAAVKWIQDNWTLAINPGADPALGEKVQYQGLFYYYMVLAQALDAAGLQTVDKVETSTTASGVTQQAVTKIDWRQALRAHLAGIQLDDGSWINGENGRWMENVPLLCTCYAMVALERCR